MHRQLETSVGNWCKPFVGINELPDTLRDSKIQFASKFVDLNIQGVGKVMMTLDSFEGLASEESFRIIEGNSYKDLSGEETERWKQKSEIRLFMLGGTAEGEEFTGKNFPYKISLKSPDGKEYTNTFLSQGPTDQPVFLYWGWKDDEGEDHDLLIPELEIVLSNIEIKFEKITG